VRSILDGERPSFPTGRERISYPADIATIRRTDRERAREIQQSNGAKFQAAFAAGMAVTGFDRSNEQGTYLLEPWE
jgi:predicted GNAT superfamily acetyltransferase